MLPGASFDGVRGSAVSTRIAERPTVPRGARVLVYLPGQMRGATAVEVRRLDDVLRAQGAADVAWVMPPIFPSREREAVTGGTAAAIVAAGVTVARDGRLRLNDQDVAGDGVHLTQSGARRLAAWLFESSVTVQATGGILAGAVVVTLLAWLYARS